jgi:hypothetical protein
LQVIRAISSSAFRAFAVAGNKGYFFISVQSVTVAGNKDYFSISIQSVCSVLLYSLDQNFALTLIYLLN